MHLQSQLWSLIHRTVDPNAEVDMLLLDQGHSNLFCPACHGYQREREAFPHFSFRTRAVVNEMETQLYLMTWDSLDQDQLHSICDPCSKNKMIPPIQEFCQFIHPCTEQQILRQISWLEHECTFLFDELFFSHHTQLLLSLVCLSAVQ